MASTPRRTSPLGWLGFPLHALLVLVPFGALSCSALFDLASHRALRISFARTSFWLLVIGLASGVVAGLFGLADAARLPEGSSARRLAMRHVAVTDVALVLFGVSMLLRRGGDYASPVAWGPIVLSVTGLAVATAGAAMGARLTYTYGVGVVAGSPGTDVEPPGQDREPPGQDPEPTAANDQNSV